MKIKKEQFKNLNQLDRIEFRQRTEWIKKYYNNDLGSWYFLNRMFFLLGFIILLGISIYNINPESCYKILNLLPLIFQVGIIIFLLLIFGEIVVSYLREKEIGKLEEEYFKIEIKSKK